MSALIACLGGWCRIREGCANYHTENREEPSERLCKKGADGCGRDVHIQIRSVLNDPVESNHNQDELGETHVVSQ